MVNDKFNEQLKVISEGKKALETAGSQKEALENLLYNEPAEVDFSQIAEELEKRKQGNEEPGANVGYTKDTIYIEDNIYKAFNALCVKRGDKKRFINEALSDFIIKKYAEIRSEEN